ncbi:hypothetical protein Rhe02_50250 [Rhizocola hellebori]|uniref:FXSXX-COOH protein n=1 Tax=Rhizocola hellebori TaxID=1392758 RepID=A0A8J3VII1_9ACTN|nr:hypothetical protein [Rhizocola hellebori]GIH06958.1 hypothetical protein Rhe02_50250 [Rhizocola hellebori]
MAPDPQLDVVTQLPRATEVPLAQLLELRLDRAVLAEAVRRVQATLDCPHEVLTAFSNFMSVHPG